MGSVSNEGMVTIQYEMPARGMAGVKSNLLSFEQGTATPFSIMKVQDRGAFFSSPGDEVYEDQIVGVNAKSGDLKVNICKAKQLTNMRSSGADEKSTCSPPLQLTLEDAVEYVI